MLRSSNRDMRLSTARINVARMTNDAQIVRSDEELAAYPLRLTERLEFWASAAPDRLFLAERRASGEWSTMTYSQVLHRVLSIGQALLDRPLSAERPIAILSDNGIEHALLGLAALHVGVPYAPIASAYSLMSSDFSKLRHVVDLLTPGLVFADNGTRFARAIASAVPADVEVVTVHGEIADREVTSFEALAGAVPTSAVARAADTVGPDTIAKFLFTSGSTGLPKAVINTQRMLCANQQMIRQSWPFLADEPPVLVDWLPWNHTFGGNFSFGLILYNGGSLYIDDGRPVPGAIERSVINLREIAPTLYFNVPKGFEVLMPYLRAEPRLRETFFSRLSMILYAGAGLSPHVWDNLDQLAIETRGNRVLISTGLGCTETAPHAFTANRPARRPGVIGLPAAGLEVKLVRSEHKLEARVRGPSVSPGYWRRPDLTAAAFDRDGFYRMGDALRWVEPDDVQQGFEFDGRIAEDFKLSTGTWVSVGPLRAAVVTHCAPLVRDVAIAGHDRSHLAALIFPDIAACRALCGGSMSDAEVLAHPLVRGWMQMRLDNLAAQSAGSSTRILRAILIHEQPSIDSGEVTDKGSLNLRAVLEQRAPLVEDMFSAEPSSCVIMVNPWEAANVT